MTFEGFIWVGQRSCGLSNLSLDNLLVKGRYLDFSHLTELKNIYITEFYMKK